MNVTRLSSPEPGTEARMPQLPLRESLKIDKIALIYSFIYLLGLSGAITFAFRSHTSFTACSTIVIRGN